MVDFMMNHIAADLRAQEDLILAESNWLDFTIFEPPQLIPTAPTGKAVVSPAKPPPGTNQVRTAQMSFLILFTCKVHVPADYHISFTATGLHWCKKVVFS